MFAACTDEDHGLLSTYTLPAPIPVNNPHATTVWQHTDCRACGHTTKRRCHVIILITAVDIAGPAHTNIPASLQAAHSGSCFRQSSWAFVLPHASKCLPHCGHLADVPQHQGCTAYPERYYSYNPSVPGDNPRTPSACSNTTSTQGSSPALLPVS